MITQINERCSSIVCKSGIGRIYTILDPQREGLSRNNGRIRYTKTDIKSSHSLIFCLRSGNSSGNKDHHQEQALSHSFQNDTECLLEYFEIASVLLKPLLTSQDQRPDEQHE